MTYYYARGKQNTDRQSELALTVNNCGYYRDLTDAIEIDRPTGRGDYHLLFCINGAILAEGERLESGDVYLFEPNQPQRYTYLPQEDSFYCWAHFTGYETREILDKAALVRGKHAFGAKCADAETLFRLMTRELGRETPRAELLAASLLSSILMLIPTGETGASPFLEAIRRLEDLGESVTVESLADMYKMSRGHFIRSFRAYAGISPYQYRVQKQMEVAKMLLSYSRLSVSEIASRVGIEDPLYFSRVFRRHVGVSPSVYRQGGAR